jgi:hypothetical protein
MHFSEDDLKDAMRRKDPGPGFTQRVMARIGQAKETQAAKAGSWLEPQKRLSWRGWTRKLHPALIGAVVALVLAAAGGLGYLEYERVRSQREAELARQRVMLALKITNAKLNHVFKRVNESINEPAAQEPKIRRQSL